MVVLNSAMAKSFLLLFVLLCSLFAFSQDQKLKPKSVDYDICLETSFLTESQMFYDESREVDYVYRFVETISEIYSQVYIEKFTYGEEGGAKILEWRKKIDMDIFYQYPIKGELTKVTFISWPSSNSVEFSIQGINFILSRLNNSEWYLEEKNNKQH